MARASGCSLGASSVAAVRRSSSSVQPSAGRISVTRGFPSVTVPVLSSTTVRTRPAPSSEDAVLKRMPWRAASPLPTMMATGVARPSAQGQLMTRTLMARASAKPKPSPARSQPQQVMSAMSMTAGTKMAETRSAILAMGALVAEASSTMWMIWLSVVSSPTRVARQMRKPLALMVAPLTALPGSLSTGTLSPVRADSSTALCPSVTTPSTGIRSPGRTTKRSPGRTSAAGITVSTSVSPAADSRTPAPSGTGPAAPTPAAAPASTGGRKTVAVSGARSIRARMASVVLPLLRASSVLPTVMSVRMVAADSK